MPNANWKGVSTWQKLAGVTLILLMAWYLDNLVHEVEWKPIGWWVLGIAISIIIVYALYRVAVLTDWNAVGKNKDKIVKALKLLAVVVLAVLIYNHAANRQLQKDRDKLAKQDAKRAHCQANPYAEGCFPETREISGVATATGPVVIVIPPHYQSELWGDTTKMKTELRRTGKLLYRYVWAKPKADTVHVTAVVSRMR